MKKKFYHHIVVIDSIHIGLDALDLSSEEKKELIEIVEKSVDHTIMDTILSELSAEDKKHFLSLVIDEDHTKVWHLLREKVEKAEEKIVKATEELVKIFHNDIVKVHYTGNHAKKA